MTLSKPIIKLNNLLSSYFNNDEVKYIASQLIKTKCDDEHPCPLIKKSNDEQGAITWLKEHPIQILADKTVLELCENNQSDKVLRYFQSVELIGFI